MGCGSSQGLVQLAGIGLHPSNDRRAVDAARLAMGGGTARSSEVMMKDCPLGSGEHSRAEQLTHIRRHGEAGES